MTTISKNSWHYKVVSIVPYFRGHEAKGLCNYMRRLIVIFSLAGLLFYIEGLTLFDFLSGNYRTVFGATQTATVSNVLHFLSDVVSMLLLLGATVSCLSVYAIAPLIGKISKAVSRVASNIATSRRTNSQHTPMSKRQLRKEQILARATQLHEQAWQAWWEATSQGRKRFACPRPVNFNECYQQAKMEFASPTYRLFMEYMNALHDKVCPRVEFTD